MEYNFDYIIEKIQSAEELEYPFKHYYIKDFFSQEHYSLLQQSSQINPPPCKNVINLINKLHKNNYEIIGFPGCVKDIKTYVESLIKNKTMPYQENEETLVSPGLCFRLKDSDDNFIKQLISFFNSNYFINCIIEKLKIIEKPIFWDFGIQKYLSGYEISPHPDVRNKKATFLININNDNLNKDSSTHTHLLKPNEQGKKIINFWENNIEFERDWLKWEECETVKTHSDTNSLLLFSPSNDTLHAIKLRYDHLNYQRTNLYANMLLSKNAGGSNYHMLSQQMRELINNKN